MKGRHSKTFTFRQITHTARNRRRTSPPRSAPLPEFGAMHLRLIKAWDSIEEIFEEAPKGTAP